MIICFGNISDLILIQTYSQINATVTVILFVGESVEENSSVVVKLLIRRPECFGPALRGEGGNGLLAAMKEALKISETPALDLSSTTQGLISDA